MHSVYLLNWNLNITFVAMKENIREIYYSKEYEQYLSSLPQRVRVKYDYVARVMQTIKVVSTKFVKVIEGSAFYEARVSVGSNEYRTVVFAIDAENFIESRRVLFLNSFLKKDKKQYKKEVEIASKILQKYMEE